MEPNLVTLGRALGREQDEHFRAGFDAERGRTRLLESVAAKPRHRAVLVLAAAAALGLALALILFPRDPAPLEFRVAGAREPGELSRRLVAPPKQELRLEFSDGTKLSLLERAEARVVSADHRGAAVRVEHGTLRAAVTHRKDARWQVRIGPFSIEVLGTRFETRWHAETERFSLLLQEGSVFVSGPVVGTKRVVTAGEMLSVSCREGELALVRARSDAAPALVIPLGPPSPGGPAPEQGGGASPQPPPADAPVSPPSSALAAITDFRELARSNQYALALQAAERADFTALCQGGSAADLLLLGDTARLAGNSERAEQAYQAVRDRFRGSNAARAGFLLGRLAFDGRSAYAEAARYFALSLLEEPRGPFSREAAGRLVESLERSGDVTGAKAAAERYLERYPEGPHAKIARALLARR